jgi:hypothetical protein
MLVGSIETDMNELIEKELRVRLEQVEYDRAEPPPFHVEYTAVSTPIGRPTTMVKCIIAHKEDAYTLHQMFGRISTPSTNRTRYLVTRDYSFTVIPHPQSK